MVQLKQRIALRSRAVLAFYGLVYALPMWNTASLAFLLAKPKYLCNGEPCSQEQFCKGPAGGGGQSVYPLDNYVAEFGLDCASAETYAALGSALYIGQILTSVTNLFENVFGAHKLFCLAVGLLALSNASTLYASSYDQLVYIYVMIGFSANMVRLYGFPLFLGHINPLKVKQLAPVNAAITAVSSAIVSAMFYLVPARRFFTHSLVMLGLVGAPTIFYFFQDVPLWLQEKGKNKQAITSANRVLVLHGGTPIKGKTLLDSQAKRKKLGKEKGKEKSQAQNPKTKYPSFWRTTLLIPLSYFAVNAVFFGKTLGLKQIKANLFVIAAFDGICGVAGHLLSKYLSGQRASTTHMLVSAIAGVGCLLLHFGNWLSWPEWALVMSIALVALSAPTALSFLNIMLYASYPTTKRTVPMLIVTVMGKLGALSSVQFVEYFPAHLFLIFGVLSFLLIPLTLLRISNYN